MAGKDDDDAPPRRRLNDLLPDYDGLLLDAFGVLNDAAGALPGAAALLAELDRRAMPFWVVTNDASRSPGSLERRFATLGLTIPADRIVTSGALLGAWFATHRLAGARTVVLGSPDSVAYAERAGATIVASTREVDLDVLCVADDSGFDFLPGIEAALSAVARRAALGRPPRLVLPNPDIIYPAADGFGFTSGAIALLLERGLERLGHPLRFEHLGKPEPLLFDEAARRAGTRRLLMVGDQLETDIAGARAAGLDAALLETGISRWRAGRDDLARPTYLVSSLA